MRPSTTWQGGQGEAGGKAGLGGQRLLAAMHLLAAAPPPAAAAATHARAAALTATSSFASCVKLFHSCPGGSTMHLQAGRKAGRERAGAAASEAEERDGSQRTVAAQCQNGIRQEAGRLSNSHPQWKPCTAQTRSTARSCTGTANLACWRGRAAGGGGCAGSRRRRRSGGWRQRRCSRGRRHDVRRTL